METDRFAGGHDWRDVVTDLGGGHGRVDRAYCRDCGLSEEPRFVLVRQGPDAGSTRRVVYDKRTCLEVTVDAVHDL